MIALVVTTPFANYERGERVTDAATAIDLMTNHPTKVIRLQDDRHEVDGKNPGEKS